MTFQLVCIEPKELTQYKADMQEAFQKGFEDAFGKTDAVILPEKDINQSLNAEGSAVYKAVVDGEMVGGAVVIINESTQQDVYKRQHLYQPKTDKNNQQNMQKAFLHFLIHCKLFFYFLPFSHTCSLFHILFLTQCLARKFWIFRCPYKMNAFISRITRLSMQPECPHSVMPVSYTHLDVYKRQHQFYL